MVYYCQSSLCISQSV